MKNNPLVSIIIPVYNGEAYIEEAVNSVLKQTYKQIEIIIVDDSSIDESASIIKGFSEPVRYFSQINGGTASARNFGIQKARGSFFAFLDQDDLWLEDKLKLQLAAFEKKPEPNIVFGHVKQFHSSELDQSVKESIYCPPSLMPGYLPSAMMVKREIFFQVGKFERAWQIGEWANWYVRASELKLRIEMLPDLIVLRRLHGTNKGVLQRELITEYAHILKASLDRRRKSE